MTSLLSKLLTAEANLTLFHSQSEGDISYGKIRAMAHGLSEKLESSAAEIYVYTRSAAAFCAAFLAAAKCGKELIVLPQAGAEYLQNLGVPLSNLVSETVEGAVWIKWRNIESNSSFEIDETLDLQFSFYTSGSSGEPKKIIKPASVIEAEAKLWSEWFGDRVSHIAGSVSHQHIYGLIFRIVLPIVSGKTSQDDMAMSWEALMANVTERTAIVSSPAHLTRLPVLDSIDFTKPAFILSSGGPLSADASFATANLFGVQPLEILGSTETGGVAWRQRKIDDEAWTPVAGVNLVIGAQGELLVASPFIPNATPVEMGDRVEVEADGRFRLLGRIDRIVKVEGKRVSLPRVEDALKSHPCVVDCAVLMTQQDQRERLSAIICLSPQGQVKLGELGAFKYSRFLRKHFQESLEPAEWPKRIRFLNEIPVNTQSKRVLSQMKELFEDQKMVELLMPDSLKVEGFKAIISFTAWTHLPWFEGHFKGNPILPGLAQTHIAARLAEDIWAAAPASMNVSRMKFQQIIQPNDKIVLSLEYKPEGQKILFDFTRDEEKVSSGVLG